MTLDFFKYPSTPHLAVLGSATVRDDKILSPREQSEFLSTEIIVEEKIDGANLGISFDCDGQVRAQNRGSFLHFPSMGQWQTLKDWLAAKLDRLFETLSDRYILFGEWCYATHSVFYDRLPDWFLGFDLYDTDANQFAGVALRNTMLAEMKITPVPLIATGQFDLCAVTKLLGKSQFGTAPAEGLCLRQTNDGKSAGRAKLVRAEFIQAIDEHWSRQPLRTNQLAANSPFNSKTRNRT